jgi:hypothetical protein
MVDINGHLFWGPAINLAWDSKETNSRLEARYQPISAYGQLFIILSGSGQQLHFPKPRLEIANRSATLSTASKKGGAGTAKPARVLPVCAA